MSKVFKALSDENRRTILKLLQQKDMSAGEIASHFNLSQPSISKHLDVLREAELVSSEKQGQFVIYSINISVLQEALGGFLNLFTKNKS